MKKILCISFALLITLLCKAQSENKCSYKDFDKLKGSWQGSLTYLDYSSGKPYTMSANLDIHRIGKTNQFSFSNIYPKEPEANSTDTLNISEDGKYIDKELVISRKKVGAGKIEIVTETLGKDGNDNKEARIRHTYTIGKTTFSIRKDVQFVGETSWIMRHEYSYKK